jgi:hypothetical protein
MKCDLLRTIFNWRWIIVAAFIGFITGQLASTIFLRIITGEAASTIIVGIITGVVASAICAHTSTWYKHKQLDKQYGPLTGRYIKRVEDKDGKPTEDIHARAYLTHCKGERRLSIKVETYWNTRGTEKKSSPTNGLGKL